MDLEGDLLVVGTKYGDAVYIFENDGSDNWVEIQTLTASDGDELLQDGYGESVSISGSTIVVGAYLHWTDVNNENPLNGAGAAYIYEQGGDGVWSETQKITSYDRDEADFFGHSVSVSGNYLISGAYYEQMDENGENPLYQSGAAYIFEKGDTEWEFVQKVVASDREPVKQYARDVHMDGSTAVVGSHLIGPGGSAYIYNRDNSGVWNEDQILNPPAAINGNAFGHAVHKDGSRMIIGSFGDSYDAQEENEIVLSGAAFIYDFDEDDVWNLTQKIVASDRGIYAYFGWSVAISGSSCLVGANSSGYTPEDESLYWTGSAYLFDTDTPQNIEDEAVLSFGIYPNPAQDVLNLTQDLNGKRVQIHSAVGQLVLSSTVENKSVNVSGLNPGMYILQIDGFKSMPVIKM